MMRSLDYQNYPGLIDILEIEMMLLNLENNLYYSPGSNMDQKIYN